ncbi:hypothetical protein C5167_041515 [Papaver somniferum]|uniref:uncharacterized protein LOC113328417 n=1 Tax=Papaver somniferum TaxID=3469 RepID=UPI000E6FC26A|nr:uncharacterized protein LOC113328417 [Papaver somniferum]RZC85334.1 hypothetical protein C5167_041515 [Papaver somniferum]
MASSSLGIRCGGSILKSSIESSSSSSCTCLHFQNHHHLKFNQQKQKRITLQGCSILSNHHHRNRRGSVGSNCTASTTTAAYLDTVFGTEMNKKEKNQQIQEKNQENAVSAVVREIKVEVYGDGEEEDEENKVPSSPISADKLDEWMTFSVPEIVKNIGEAPLLVQIYSSISKGVGGISSIGSSNSTSTTAAEPVLEKTKADADSWNGVTKRWEEGSLVPDGIILVEQLKAEESDGGEDENDEVIASDMSGNSSSSTKTWGVVIQGRGVESASSCYILKTCRVGSSLGFCTHFCLARAKCFGESAVLQLKYSWLLGH